MPTSPRRAFTSLALVLVAAAGTACSAFTSDSAPSNEDPKARIVEGTPDQSEITEELGVFVTVDGKPENTGSRERPLGSIQAGIALGKKNGKRVYVCSGTFHEALTLANSISIIGGLTCSGATWKTGGVRTRIEAPSSPAIRAKDIASPTRLEGIDVVAPNATKPSGSSIGILADHAEGLTIAGSKITAGDGANGVDGTEGTQLTQLAAIDGERSVVNAECVPNVTCMKPAIASLYPWLNYRGGYGGKSTCVGAPGHDGLPGGNGGSGGIFYSYAAAWFYYADSLSFAPAYGQVLPGTAGAAGIDGAPSGAFGTLSSDGYAAVDGIAGTDGAPGNGGSGGRGSAPLKDASHVEVNIVWRGMGGPGGGAGGCPGLAATAGTGGGASIALALVDSPVVVDNAELIAGRAGSAGHGAFGSDPTAGGKAGVNDTAPNNNAANGGNGGPPGISTNGSNGSSAGVLHTGAPPVVRNGVKITPGPAGLAIEVRSHSVFGTTRTIPATPAGISKDIVAL
jgi:hypothetical protein